MRLPVLSKSQPPDLAELGKLLSGRLRGDVRFTAHDRALYSTDASIYQVMPLGVVVPADENDAQLAVQLCQEAGVPVLPRGGGTSLAGQCTNRAVVLDLSPRLRRVWDLSICNKTVRAQAGAPLEEINRYLLSAQSGLFYAPDPASQAQASLGGCIGNNAAGARSVKYGRTSENILTIDAILASGARTSLSKGSGRFDATARDLAVKVAAIVLKRADLIRERFPKTIRRNAGYGLDLILKQLDGGMPPEDLDLTGLICGSEGTLALVVSATLRLRPVPSARGLAIVSFASLDAAIDHVVPFLATNPSAVELMDDVVLEAAAGNNECRKFLSLLPRADSSVAKAVLYVEYEASGKEELQHHFDQLRERSRLAAGIVCYTDADAIGKLWALRKAGEPLLHQIGGGPDDPRKPQTFVEDNAVPPERLLEFVRAFREIVSRHGTSAAFYAHASVGVLHVRPLIDLHNSTDRDAMRAIAVEVADLARQCGGVMSGEHGDGRVRGPLLERFYGSELMSAFREIKALFDPKNLLNPGNLADPAPLKTISENLRIDRQALSTRRNSVETYFDYSDQHGFSSAVEMCNGAGVCRKTAGGTMCPSYRALLDERHSTRGRGNALRLAITGQLSAGVNSTWDDPGTLETLDLCLSCKACKSECPSNVDIARLKAEYLAQKYRTTHPSLQARAFGNVRRLNQLASMFPSSANCVARLRPVRALMNHVLGLHPARSLPPFASSLRKWIRSRKPSESPRQNRRRVVLFEDCFTGFNEPHIGQMAFLLLEAFGYEVLLPRVGCCGRPMISTGLLRQAIATIDSTSRVLLQCLNEERIDAVLFLEPSCLSAVKDDWLQLKLPLPISDRKRLAEKSMAVEEFIDQFWDSHPQRPSPAIISSEILLHGHCHQKALWGESACAASLRRIAPSVKVLPTGCCGMAGSFGFTADRYELSTKIGELSLFPAIREAAPTTLLAAPGTSCRHQIHDGTRRSAIHPVELWGKALSIEPRK